MLMMGGSIGGVAKELGLPKATVQRWHEKLKKAENDPRAYAGHKGNLIQYSPTYAQRTYVEGDTLAGLLTELIRQQLVTLIAQQEHFRDPEWLSRQNAADLSLLFGVSADKLMKALEAIEKANARQAQLNNAQAEDVH